MDNQERARNGPAVVSSTRCGQSGKKVYEAPELVRWGTIAELTRAKEEPITDFFDGTDLS